MNIMTAKEAREKLELVDKEDKNLLYEIMQLLNKAIERHDNYIYYSKHLPNYTINQLRELGYTVSDEEQGDRPFDSSYRKISF